MEKRKTEVEEQELDEGRKGTRKKRSRKKIKKRVRRVWADVLTEFVYFFAGL